MNSESVQEDAPPDVSFAGCGFLGIYHVGATACLLIHAPHLLENNVIGASAGAMMAAALVGEVPLPDMTRAILNVVERARAVAPIVLSSEFKLDEALNDNFQKIFPDDIHLRVNDRVYVAMTTLINGKQLMVNKFSSKNDLISALRASSYVPFLANWGFPRFRGQLVCDGIVSAIHPTRPSTSTITVSPLWAGWGTISPFSKGKLSLLVDLWFAGWPPSVARMERLCQQGYEDAMTFLLDKKYLSCPGCEQDDQEICASVHPTEISPEMKKVFEEAKGEELRGYDKWLKGLFCLGGFLTCCYFMCCCCWCCGCCCGKCKNPDEEDGDLGGEEKTEEPVTSQPGSSGGVGTTTMPMMPMPRPAPAPTSLSTNSGGGITDQ